MPVSRTYSLDDLAGQFRASALEQRVVWFREATLPGVLSMLGNLLEEYTLYRATDANGADLFDAVLARNFEFLQRPTALPYWIDFYSGPAPIFRPSFCFQPTTELRFDIKLMFDLFEFPQPPPVNHLLEKLQSLATLLGSKHWSIHHEVNNQWQGGDFSDATLIYEKRHE
jgi:hypothetical protein